MNWFDSFDLMLEYHAMTAQQTEAHEKGYLSDDGRLTPKGALVNIEQMLQPGYQGNLRTNAIAVTSLDILGEVVRQRAQMEAEVISLNETIRDLVSEKADVVNEEDSSSD